jgi:hypothetical protein
VCGSSALFDDLVSAREQHRRDVEAKYPGGLGVDDQLEFARITGNSSGLVPLRMRPV